jgi:hypothetical protein
MAGNRARYPKYTKWTKDAFLATIVNKLLTPIQPMINNKNLFCIVFMLSTYIDVPKTKMNVETYMSEKHPTHCNMIVIGDTNYKSQKECISDIRNKLSDIGITSSVKNYSTDIYEYFVELCKRHPTQEEKLKNIADLEIKQDALNKRGLALNIINRDGTTTEISWRICVSGKGHTPSQLYNMALRQTISSQIQIYRENENATNCSMCGTCLTDKICHIDHDIHFAKLVDDFTTLHNITVPTEYNKKPITFERTFTLKDEWIGNLFYEYHLVNAKLRAVCEKCNLTREKYKKGKV